MDPFGGYHGPADSKRLFMTYFGDDCFTSCCVEAVGTVAGDCDSKLKDLTPFCTISTLGVDVESLFLGLLAGLILTLQWSHVAYRSLGGPLSLITGESARVISKQLITAFMYGSSQVFLLLSPVNAV